MKIKHIFYISFLLIFMMQTSLKPQDLERKDVQEGYKWNLNEIYPDVNAWRAAKEDASDKIASIVRYKGKLSESAKNLYNALKNYFDVLKELYRVSDYAERLSDEDLRISKNQSLTQETSQLGTEFSEKTAFLSPEILNIDPGKIDSFMKKEKGLSEYKMFIDDIQRLRKHTLSEREEKILASFGSVTQAPSNVYNIFNNAEFPFAEVKLSNGKEIKLTSSSYTKYRSVPERNDRAEIFKAFFEKYGNFQNTLGANLGGKVTTFMLKTETITLL